MEKEKVEDFLVEQLAVVYFTLRFERVYSVIFGSQIELLKRINELGDKSIDRNEVENYFDRVSKAFPKIFKEADCNKYLKLLLDYNIIKFNKNINGYNITEFGKDFLLGITMDGRKENKPF